MEAVIFDWFGVCAEKWIDVWERETKLDRDKLREAFFRYLDQYANNSITGDEFLQKVIGGSEYNYLLYKHGEINEELLDVIKRLRTKYKTAILSDNFNEIVPVIEKEIGGFDKYFDVIALSNRLNLGKTEPWIYRKTLSELEVQPEEAVFIDDKQKNLDVANELGIKTILFENNEQLWQELCSYGLEFS